jgi:hypothetical protein
MDYYLRTETKEETDSILVSLGLLNETRLHNGSVVHTIPDDVSIDYIGEIIKFVINGTNPKTNIPNVSTIINPEFHTNIRVMFELTEDQVKQLPLVDPPPATPQRMFT